MGAFEFLRFEAVSNFSLVSAIIVALVAGKGIAAELAGRAFKYTPAARMTMWSLTLPQVAATLAATLTAGFRVCRHACGRASLRRVPCQGI
jgi:predicted lysophospholipase L1 biosynthesis ABC-type transport system permease subunit